MKNVVKVFFSLTHSVNTVELHKKKHMTLDNSNWSYIINSYALRSASTRKGEAEQRDYNHGNTKGGFLL